jgi:hypothetical protein
VPLHRRQSGAPEPSVTPEPGPHSHNGTSHHPQNARRGCEDSASASPDRRHRARRDLPTTARPPPLGASLAPVTLGCRPLMALARSATVHYRATPSCSRCVSAPPASTARGQCYQTTEHLNTPLNNPSQLSEGDLTEIEVTDPTHPLFGRRFPLLSARPQPSMATHVFVAYQGCMVLRIPRTATNLLPQLSRVPTTLTSHAITELIALAEQCEVLCHTTPEPSGTSSAQHSRPTSAPNSRPSSRR